jgi:hypothetical protein
MDYSSLPDWLSQAITPLLEDTNVNEGVRMMRERAADLPHQEAVERGLAADLIGLSLVPEARRRLEDAMDAHWAEGREKNIGMASRSNRLVVIGGGYHAAIVCAVQAQMGMPPPLVIEQSDHPGGSLACSRQATFYANSRNRPGKVNVPGQDGGLNTIPGAMVQPSMLGSAEYQTNADIAYAVRLALAMYGRVAAGRRVEQAELTNTYPQQFALEITDPYYGDRRRIRAQTVIDARGPGVASDLGGSRVLTFAQFMAHMDKPFPLQGLRRVAVIGNGDSAKCAVEALFGLGPRAHYSIADMDRIERCDWYSPNSTTTCEEFRTAERQRYKGISALLPRREDSKRRPRLVIYRGNGVVEPGFDDVTVNERRYDMAIVCVGLNAMQPFARRGGAINVVGAMDVPGWSDLESQMPYAQFPQNRMAMWRLAPRTAKLAASIR